VDGRRLPPAVGKARNLPSVMLGPVPGICQRLDFRCVGRSSAQGRGWRRRGRGSAIHRRRALAPAVWSRPRRS